MKLFIILACFVLTFQNSKCQNLFDISPPIIGGINNMSKIFTGCTDSTGFSVIAEIPLYKGLDSSQYEYQPVFCRFDFNGNLLIQKKLNSGFQNPFNCNRFKLYQKNDSIYYYLTYININNGFYYDQAIFELNMHSGELVKSKELTRAGGTFHDSQILTAINTKNNQIVIASFLHSKKIGLTTLDTNLNFILVDSMSVNNYLLAPDFIEELPKNEIRIIGDLFTPTPNSTFKRSMFYLILNSNNEIQDFKELNAPSQNNWGQFSPAHYSCISTNDTSITMFISEIIKLAPNISCSVPHFLNYSLDGKRLNWHTDFYDRPKSERPNYSAQAMVTATDKTGYLGVSWVVGDTSASESYCELYKVSNSGEKLWKRKLVPLGFENEKLWYAILNPILATPFNSYILLGDFGYRAESRVKPWILHIDKDGCLIPNCGQTSVRDNPTDANQFIEIYPTIIQNNTLHFLSHVDKTNTQLAIFSIHGHMLHSAMISLEKGNQYILDIPETMVAGEYILRFENVSFSLSFKFVKVI